MPANSTAAGSHANSAPAAEPARAAGEGDARPRAERDSELAQRPLDFSIIRRLYACTLPYQRLRALLLLLVVLRSVQLPIIAWLTAWVISGPIAAHDASGIVRGVLGFLAWTAFTAWCFIFRSRLALQLGESVVSDLRRQIYEHLLRLPMSYFKRTEVGRLIGRVVHDVDSVRVGVQDVFFVSVVQCGSMLVSAGLMAYYDWPLFLVVLAMAPGLWAVTRYFRKKSSVAYRERSESFARVTASLAESVNGIREIQSFARQEHNARSFARLIDQHAQVNMHSHRLGAVFQPVLAFNGQLFLSFLLVLGGYQVLGGGVDLEALIQFLFLSTSFFNGIPIVGEQYNQALTAMAGAERVFRLLDTQPDWQDAPSAQDFDRIDGRVEFAGVSFEYEPGRPVLHDIDFVAQPGQAIALVGHTGSGKSTIANLIAKLYLPSGGRVSIDGHDLMNMTSQSLHRQIACVTQHNFLFSGSVLENVRLGRPEATRDEVLAALDKLGVTDIIMSLPAGLDSKVGERGVGLSLGQRQIVCFARAMLADPRVVILDEATSSVDSVTEARVQQALFRLLAGRTSFVVAHRLSTIVHADQVLVLDHGRIVERGNHSALIEKGGVYSGLYREFVSAQAMVA
ncbi:MAG TPA: ABC transporter ATP-binding protein [Polyangiaceae bacterium]|nr:ABC transporter ATP-binding protein [Polyangiaceae bacterium]